MGYDEDAYKDPDVLRELYHDEKMTLEEVGDELGMAFTTIQKWMDIHDIPRREYGPLEQRFELYYDEGDEDECWEWQMNTDRWGHGTLTDDEGNSRYAHRVAYIKKYGEIPDGKQINHACRNSKCVNPNHLYAGTQHENVDDEIDAGVWQESRPEGEQVRTSKLTRNEVAEIKRRYRDTDATQGELADEFDMGQTQISRIVREERWAHVDPDE
jgi:hypothetical protein